jgi:hypothetical protein
MHLLNCGSKAPGLRNLRVTFTSPRHRTLKEREIAQCHLDGRLLGLQKRACGIESKKCALVKDRNCRLAHILLSALASCAGCCHLDVWMDRRADK